MGVKYTLAEGTGSVCLTIDKVKPSALYKVAITMYWGDSVLVRIVSVTKN